jgi:hypothetical protein
MKKCSFFQENLAAFLDGELKPKFACRIQEHLDLCADCRGILKLHKQERRWLRQHNAEIEPSIYLWQRIEQNLDAEAEARSSLWDRLAAVLLPVPGKRLQNAAIGLILASALCVSMLLPFQSGTTWSNDQYVRQSMEQYIQWRESQQPLWDPYLATPISSIHELRSMNPFLENQSPAEKQNPFGT